MKTFLVLKKNWQKVVLNFYNFFEGRNTLDFRLGKVRVKSGPGLGIGPRRGKTPPTRARNRKNKCQNE